MFTENPTTVSPGYIIRAEGEPGVGLKIVISQAQIAHRIFATQIRGRTRQLYKGELGNVKLLDQCRGHELFTTYFAYPKSLKEVRLAYREILEYYYVDGGMSPQEASVQAEVDTENHLKRETLDLEVDSVSYLSHA